jgi:hypothetical protein
MNPGNVAALCDMSCFLFINFQEFSRALKRLSTLSSGIIVRQEIAHGGEPTTNAQKFYVRAHSSPREVLYE